MASNPSELVPQAALALCNHYLVLLLSPLIKTDARQRDAAEDRQPLPNNPAQLCSPLGPRPLLGPPPRRWSLAAAHARRPPIEIGPQPADMGGPV